MVKKGKNVKPALVIVICAVIVIAAAALTGYRILRTKYTGNHVAYSMAQLAALDKGSLEYKIASSFFTEEQLSSIRSSNDVPDSGETALADQPETEADLDVNGDGVYIEHIYSSTYEGYMMVVKDPSQVSIAINPNLGSSADA
ncbi:MAG: hypothetical protein EOM64_10845, partial [Erysipelotrichia bacterium]|nr:hypothetical protein [Erysipelotrichia bacterium]